jgi:regulator of PEP synthase PpsR (kinase-PPPase family)
MVREYHLHLISDSTGETLNTVAKAVCAQFDGVTVREHIYSLVRNRVQLRRAVEQVLAGEDTETESGDAAKLKAAVTLLDETTKPLADLLTDRGEHDAFRHDGQQAP